MTKIIHGRVTTLNTKLKSKTLNLKRFNTILFTALAGLSIFYLVLINDLTVQGFVLQNLNSRANNLANINMNIQEQVNVARSFPALNARLPELHLVAANNIQYLSAHGSMVAKK